MQKYGMTKRIIQLAGEGNLPAGFLLVSNLNKSPSVHACDNAVVADIATSLREFVHDLNNPLAVVMGFAQLLELNSDCNGKVQADIEKISEELKNVVHIVERLHGYAISLGDKPKTLIPDSEFLIPESELLTPEF